MQDLTHARHAQPGVRDRRIGKLQTKLLVEGPPSDRVIRHDRLPDDLVVGAIETGKGGVVNADLGKERPAALVIVGLGVYQHAVLVEDDRFVSQFDPQFANVQAAPTGVGQQAAPNLRRSHLSVSAFVAAVQKSAWCEPNIATFALYQK